MKLMRSQYKERGVIEGSTCGSGRDEFVANFARTQSGGQDESGERNGLRGAWGVG